MGSRKKLKENVTILTGQHGLLPCNVFLFALLKTFSVTLRKVFPISAVKYCTAN